MDHKNVFAFNLNRQMELHGKSRREVCQALGFNYYTFTDWVKGKKMPRMDKVELLANYFGILKSDLIEEKGEKPITKDDDGLSKSQLELMQFARGLSPYEAEQVLQTMKLLVQGLRK